MIGARLPKTLALPLAVLIVIAIEMTVYRALGAIGVNAYPWYAGAALFASLLILLFPSLGRGHNPVEAPARPNERWSNPPRNAISHRPDPMGERGGLSMALRAR